MSELENRYTWMNAPAATANGDLNGQGQDHAGDLSCRPGLLDRILEGANLRLRAKMSGGQYDLERHGSGLHQRSPERPGS